MSSEVFSDDRDIFDFNAGSSRRNFLKKSGVFLAVGPGLIQSAIVGLARRAFAGPEKSTCIRNKTNIFLRKIIGEMHGFVDSEEMREQIIQVAGMSFSDSFGFEFEPIEGVAQFNGLRRKIKLNPDFDPDDAEEISCVVHELVHVRQDDELRKTVETKRYENFWQNPLSRHVAVVSHEADAISIQLEVLNVASRGKLKKYALGENADFAPHTNNGILARMLPRLAKVYFGHSHAEFLASVKSILLETPGIVLFNPDLTLAK